eukprot:s792_g17.t1
MSYGDSNAVFEQRALHMGLDAGVLKAFVDKGYKNMAMFAFSCNYSLGASSDKPFLDMIVATLGREAIAAELSILRRLFNESYANVAADIEKQVKQTDESVTRKLAPAERAERLRVQQRKLTGISIRGQYEPADASVDRCCAAYESDRLSYIDWSVCISREYELANNVKKDTDLSFGSDGVLKLARTSKIEPMQGMSEIQVRYALVRRGLAMDQANILEFAKHDQLVELPLDVRMQEPPAGYQRLSMKQLEAADKKFFVLLGEATRSGIKASSTGRPCDTVFDKVFDSAEFRHLLQPRMTQTTSSAAPVHKESPAGTSDPPAKKAKTGTKGKGRGKAAASPFQRIPTELLKLGAVGATPKGNRLCFGFNLKSCNLPVNGQKCERGLHLCDASAAVGTGLKRGPELEQSSSTKLQAVSSASGSVQKQWTKPLAGELGQASPGAAQSSAGVSKTDDAPKFLHEPCTENSFSTMESPSSLRDAPIFIEACAGCGILSSVVQQRGFQVIPIDCPRNGHVPKCRLIVMDLTSKHADELLKKIVTDYNVVGVHIALPCGTCSKARGIPMPDGTPGPPPLRDMDNLHGFQHLTPVQRAKVDAANALYAWADQFIQFLHGRGVAWSVENPKNSWLWELAEMSFALARGYFVCLHSCAYGGERKKNTAFLCSEEEFTSLEKYCDGSHPHKEWGYDFDLWEFNTAKEAEYPRALCEQYANILERMVYGTISAQRISGDFKSKLHPQQQSKGRTVPQIVSEFAAVRTLVSTSILNLNDKKVLLQA